MSKKLTPSTFTIMCEHDDKIESWIRYEIMIGIYHKELAFREEEPHERSDDLACISKYKDSEGRFNMELYEDEDEYYLKVIIPNNVYVDTEEVVYRSTKLNNKKEFSNKYENITVYNVKDKELTKEEEEKAFELMQVPMKDTYSIYIYLSIDKKKNGETRKITKTMIHDIWKIYRDVYIRSHKVGLTDDDMDMLDYIRIMRGRKYINLMKLCDDLIFYYEEVEERYKNKVELYDVIIDRYEGKSERVRERCEEKMKEMNRRINKAKKMIKYYEELKEFFINKDKGYIMKNNIDFRKINKDIEKLSYIKPLDDIYTQEIMTIIKQSIVTSLLTSLQLN